MFANIAHLSVAPAIIAVTTLLPSAEVIVVGTDQVNENDV